MNIFAARGRGMKLVINKAKNSKFKTFEQNTCYISQKKAKNM